MHSKCHLLVFALLEFWPFAPTQNVENEFDPRRNTDFLKNTEQIILHRVMAQRKLLRDFMIGETSGYKSSDLLFSFA